MLFLNAWAHTRVRRQRHNAVTGRLIRVEDEAEASREAALPDLCGLNEIRGASAGNETVAAAVRLACFHPYTHQRLLPSAPVFCIKTMQLTP